MTAAILLAFVVVFGCGFVAESVYIWWLLGERAQNAGSHARPRPLRPAAAERPDGAAPAPSPGAAPASPSGPAFSPDQMLGARFDAPDQTGKVIDFEPVDDTRPDAPAPDSLEWHAQTPAAAHANAMWQASKPYLPDTPPPIRLDRPAVRREVPGHPPWTGSQAALTEADIIEQNRQRVIRTELEALGDDPTESGVGRVMLMARALPASGAAGPELARRVIA